MKQLCEKTIPEIIGITDTKHLCFRKLVKCQYICMEVHGILGKGFLEIVYKDALEYEFRKNNFIIC